MENMGCTPSYKGLTYSSTKNILGNTNDSRVCATHEMCLVVIGYSDLCKGS